MPDADGTAGSPRPARMSHQARQRELGLADKAMAPGTYLRFPKMGDGIYERFEKSKLGANAHYVRFEKGGLQKLELKKIPANQWNVLSAEQVKEAIDGQLVAASRKKGNDAEIGRLLSQGANKDAVDRQGCPAVWHAADRGHCGNVRQLVMKGADVGARTRAGQTPLMCACYNGHNEVVDFLLQSGAEVNAEKQGGNTALMAAAAQGHATCVEMLLRHGANANAATADGWTALIASANCREPTGFYCARHLLAAGADPLAACTEDEQQMTPLAYAEEAGRTEMVDLLRTAEASQSSASGGEQSAPAPEAQPTPSPEVKAESTLAPELSLDAWLANLQLESYAEPMKAEGYESLSFLKVAESEDIDEMIADIKMKKPHARMFKKGLAELLGGGPEEA